MSNPKQLQLKLAVEVLRRKPSLCKRKAEEVQQYLYKTTGVNYERDDTLHVCRVVRNEFYPSNKLFHNELNELKDYLGEVNEKISLSVQEENKTIEKNDRINTPGMYIILPCVHVPFHNKMLWNSLLNYIYDNNEHIQGILIIGDFLDLNSLSAHDKNMMPMNGITLDYEYKEGNKALDSLDKAMGRSNYIKYYLFGNHEDRYFRTIKDVNHAKYGESLLSPTKALNLVARGYNVLDNWKNDSIKVGDHLELIHGEYITTNSAKKHIDVYRKSIAYAHTHRISSYLEGQTAGYNLGFMGDKNSPAFSYATRGMKSSWNNGFGIVNLTDNLYFNLQQVIWYDTCFYVGHKKY
jgi:hypothetical protein